MLFNIRSFVNIYLGIRCNITHKWYALLIVTWSQVPLLIIPKPVLPTQLFRLWDVRMKPTLAFQAKRYCSLRSEKKMGCVKKMTMTEKVCKNEEYVRVFCVITPSTASERYKNTCKSVRTTFFLTLMIINVIKLFTITGELLAMQSAPFRSIPNKYQANFVHISPSLIYIWYQWIAV